MQIIRKKAADVEAHTKIAAIIGNATEEEKYSLSKYGRLLGMIIIIGDDLMDVFEYKELKNRVKRECLPLPVIYALFNRKKSENLQNIIISRKFSKELFRKLMIEIEQIGGFKSVKQTINQFMKEASNHLRNMIYSEKLDILLKAFTIQPTVYIYQIKLVSEGLTPP